MTKRQNRVRGFGKRSLSVLLATLIVLSTMVVMLTSTMLTAHAAISYWYLIGDFNDWNINNETYRMSKSGNNWVVNIPPVAATAKFKAIAVENGNKYWNGLRDSTEVWLGADDALKWEQYGNSGNDIRIKNAPENPTSFTVYIYEKNGGNNISIVANTVPVESGSKNIGKTFNAPSSVAPGNTDGDGIFWAKATYYDYISDWEYGHTNWLKPVKAGTGHNWSNDEWYPFFGINGVISSQYSGKSAKPLYFGNYCYTQGAYDTSGHHYGTNNGFSTATNGLTNFSYAVNNSNQYNYSSGAYGGQGLANYYQSYQGLMNNHLGSNGELLMAGSNTEAPYFNKNVLGNYVNVVNSAFPFRVTDNGAYKTYQFNSNNGQDNVYFNWEADGNSTKPTSVHYANYSHMVKDGISDFMHNESSGYGIFPFNGGTGNKNNTNENLDYGFGVKMEVQFRVPAPSSTVNTSSNPIKFDFSGDDDLWMYITDNETGESHLILDMGGNHKKSSGSVNFNTLTSKVDHVYQGNNTSDASSTKTFSQLGLDFDYNKTYTMTVFYMERGLIESNCEMTFSMYPAGNQVNVEKEVNTTNINHTSNSTALQDAVAEVDTFGFTAYQAGSENGSYTALKGTQYLHNYNGNMTTNSSSGEFKLEDGEMASFLSKYSTNNYAQVRETSSGSKLSYSTTWSVKDPLNGSRDQSGSGLTAAKLQLKNPSGESYDYAQLDYKFVNTPNTGKVSITKTIPNATSTDLSQTFNAKVLVSLAGASGPYYAYPLSYKASGLSGTYETNINGYLDSRALLKAGRTLTFSDLPTNAYVRVEEQLSSEQHNLYTCTYQGGVNQVKVPSGGTSSITIVNTPLTPDSATGFINGYKELDDEYYTGDMFKFVLEGYHPAPGDPDTVIDTSDIFDTTTTCENGVFRFGDMAFDRAGVYRYHVYEDTSYLDPDGTAANTFNTDFNCTSTEFLVSITVKEVNHKLVVEQPVYFPYTPTEAPTTDPSVFIDDEPAITPADFDPSKQVDKLVIKNSVNVGNLRIEKENQKGEKVDGVEFAVYEVDEDMQLILDDSNKSGDKKYDMIIMHINVEDIPQVASGITGQASADGKNPAETGVAFINGLDIFNDNFVKETVGSGVDGLTIMREDFTGYKKYILLELASAGTDGYSVNKTVGAENGTVNACNVFSFPINDEYNFTFQYINNQLKNPNTAGVGMTLFKIIGSGLAVLSLLALGGYMLYTKKFAKRKTVKNNVK